MPILNNYQQFNGRHWETGTVHNYFAYRGVKAPHTGQPYSEALLMGVSGGIVIGYFSFAYEGYDPQCNILTRNTFDPFDTMLQRLGVVQYLEQTNKPDKAVANLLDALNDGVPPIVWADMWLLPYNALEYDKGMWGMFPIVVYGYDANAGQVHIADRAAVPLVVTPEEMLAARARVKKTKFRLLTLDAPNPDKLETAVSAGIWDTIKLYTEKPPKGSKNNFGLAAYQNWANLLTKPKQRQSWEKVFPPGAPMYAGLTSAYSFALLFGQGLHHDADRNLYADFLDEAAVILNRPALSEAAVQFRAAAAAWQILGGALLPDDVAPFAEARGLLDRKHDLFIRQGAAGLDEIQQINGRLAAIRAAMESDFPLEVARVVELRENIAAQVLAVRDVEATAVSQLRQAMV